VSWHFSQALVAAYSAANFSGGLPSARSSGSLTPQAFLCSDRMKAFLRLSRFGMTFAPLTDALGEAVLTWFLAGFPAKTFPQPERAQESTENAADCGEKWPASFARFDPVSASWKTAQCSFHEDSEQFSVTWPRWGMTVNGECLELQRLVLPIKENASGSLAAAPDQTRPDQTRPEMANAYHKYGQRHKHENIDTQNREVPQKRPAGSCGVISPDNTDTQCERRQLPLEWIDPTEQQLGGNGQTRGDCWRNQWATEPDVGRVADGVAARVDRLKAIGNGQVPAVAALAWTALSGAA